MSYYFAIVGTRDNPLYESNFSSSKFPSPAPLPPNVVAATSLFANGLTAPAPTVPGTGSAGLPGYGHKNSRHVMQMVAHASLDAIEDIQWSVPTMYLKQVDRFHEWNVSAWATPGGMKLILLWDTKNDDGIRLFLHESWEAYTKHLLNPFYEVNAPIRSRAFDNKIRASAKRHL